MRLAVSLALLALPLAAVSAAECPVSAPVNLGLDLNGVSQVEVHQADTDLHISGGSGPVLVGRACAANQKDLQRLVLSTRRQGSTLIVQVGPPGSHFSWHISESPTPYLDVKLGLPAQVGFKVISGSGDISASGLPQFALQNGSGDVLIDHIAGRVVASAGSGDITLREVGSVQIDHLGSGDLKASAVHGPVAVNANGSGDITVANTNGGFSLGHSGSGDINLNAIGGSVQIDGIGSGDVMARQIKGNLLIGSIGSGDVNADQISGDLTIRSQGSGDVNQHGVSGRVSIPGRH